MERIIGKVAVVTGGGSGIGRGIALGLASAGARVVVCGRREDKLKETCRMIEANGGEALALPVDVASVSDVSQLVVAVVTKFGHVDILINNAGISDGGYIHESEINSWDEVMSINLKGPYLLTRAVLPHMRSQKCGHIINISSESGLEYYTGDGVYGTSKHALNAFSEYTQRENQDFNIRVNTICPGMVVSEMTDATPGLDRQKCLYPEDIADLVLWLLTRRENIKIGTPILIQTMLNPWE